MSIHYPGVNSKSSGHLVLLSVRPLYYSHNMVYYLLVDVYTKKQERMSVNPSVRLD
jgi:hypothetical protein